MNYGAVELLKWLAFAAMIADHVSLVLLDGASPWLRHIGTFAYPAFALAFGHGLGRSNDPLSAGTRLLLPAVVAAAVWAAIGEHFPANVLVLFAAVAIVVALLDMLPIVGLIALGWIVLTSPGWEGGFLGLALVLGAAGRARWRSSAWVVASAAWCYLHPSFGAIVACAAYWAAPRLLFTIDYRARWLAWAYPGHLAALAALRWVV